MDDFGSIVQRDTRFNWRTSDVVTPPTFENAARTLSLARWPAKCVEWRLPTRDFTASQ
ncbi:Uncharacterised protein [Vibrio cholerae]|nr:Uncharacterised protein [Vibrio cholerae]CSC64838.1 Uncharacterised protein [Vibrio cholerae]CSI51557.1 Uncharacterised protein [Vibrio cholerae]CSI60889.1 Uncharacterised protein [Vibrio cholerae]